MTTNQIGNDDDGVSVSSAPRVEAGGMATELIRLSRHLSNAAHSAERLASQFAKPVESATPTSEPAEALKTAYTGKEAFGPAIGISRTEPEPTSEWGDPIAVDGKRPEWLRGDRYQARGAWAAPFTPGSDALHWPHVRQIRLPASHPYYLATSRGFTYWPGGEVGPIDWDGGPVLMRHSDGSCVPLNMTDCQDREASGWNWPANECEGGKSHGFIGYRRKPEVSTSCPHIGMCCKGVVRVPCAECDRVITFRDGEQTDEGDAEAVDGDPRAPLMAEVEQLKRDIMQAARAEVLDDTKVRFNAGAAIGMISRLAAELIAQDKRLFEARTYDDAAREAARRAAYKRFNTPPAGCTSAEMVDVIATALGLQRACNAAAT